jgi:S-adenosylhomocysteine hydrolase
MLARSLLKKTVGFFKTTAEGVASHPMGVVRSSLSHTAKRTTHRAASSTSSSVTTLATREQCVVATSSEKKQQLPGMAAVRSGTLLVTPSSTAVRTMSTARVRHFTTQANDKTPIEPHPIPQLKEIDEMVAMAKATPGLPDLSNTMMIGVQHMLETTTTIFEGYIKLGFNPRNMYFSGKCYSSALAVEERVRQMGIHLMPTGKPDEPGQYHQYCVDGMKRMWQYFIADIKNKNVDRIIILDEGGRCIEVMPEYLRFQFPFGSVEQTRAGLYSRSLFHLPFSLVDVASSAVKKILEPPLIAEAVLNGIIEILPRYGVNREMVCGVVGNGAVGRGIAEYLLAQGYSVLVFDKDENSFSNLKGQKFVRMRSIADLISNAQCVFGCTGLDITQGLDIFDITKGNKIFISCSSEDKEFLSLLKLIAERNLIAVDPFADMVCRVPGTKNKIIVARGGFPANFNRNPWNVRAENIAITQCLLFGGVVQAITIAEQPKADGYTVNNPTKQILDPHIQATAVRLWRRHHPNNYYTQEQLARFEELDWINNNSGAGNVYVANSFVGRCYPFDFRSPALPAMSAALVSADHSVGSGNQTSQNNISVSFPHGDTAMRPHI